MVVKEGKEVLVGVLAVMAALMETMEKHTGTMEFQGVVREQLQELLENHREHCMLAAAVVVAADSLRVRLRFRQVELLGQEAAEKAEMDSDMPKMAAMVRQIQAGELAAEGHPAKTQNMLGMAGTVAPALF